MTNNVELALKALTSLFIAVEEPVAEDVRQRVTAAFKDLNYIDNVKDFHMTFKHPILAAPSIPNKQRVELRLNLLKEELKELEDAINKGDLVEVGDAFCDLQYVLSGAVLEFGFAHKFLKMFLEVHRSNMSKSCVDSEEADATIAQAKLKEPDEDFYKMNYDGRYLVYRKRDNKTIKSINYSPADLRPIVEG